MNKDLPYEWGMTNEDAREHICPISMNQPVRSTCIGKSCMAWRKQTSKAKTYNGAYTDRDETGRGWTDFGYCGLAGPLKSSNYGN